MEINEIIKLMKAVRENELTSFELEEGNLHLALRREQQAAQAETAAPGSVVYVQGFPGANMAGAQAAAPAPLPAASSGNGAAAGALASAADNAAAEAGAHEPGETAGSGSAASASEKVVASPLVGVFYNAASPDAEPFIRVGDTVRKGQVIGIVEAMKLMNEIESDQEGVVTDILVKNEEVVEYGQPLIRVK